MSHNVSEEICSLYYGAEVNEDLQLSLSLLTTTRQYRYMYTSYTSEHILVYMAQGRRTFLN